MGLNGGLSPIITIISGCSVDIQFIICTEDQVINGFQFQKGDIVVMDSHLTSLEGLSDAESELE